MKKEKIFIFIFIFLLILLIIPRNVLAISNAVYLGGEELSCISGVKTDTNMDGTAVFDCENNVLTLTDYDGPHIDYSDGGEFTIVLEGENKITASSETDGIYFLDSDVLITGDGSLLIDDVFNGFLVGGSTLTIDEDATVSISNIENVGIEMEMTDLVVLGNLSIQNALNGGIEGIDVGDSITISGNLSITDIVNFGIVERGSINITGNVSMDSKIDDDYFTGYVAIKSFGDISIDGNINIKNAITGLDSNGEIEIKSGTLSISAIASGIHSAKRMIIEDGTLDIEIIDGDYFLPRYGINASELLKIDAGEIHVKVPEGDTAIVVFDIDENAEIEISEDLEIIPKDYDISDIEVVPDQISKTIAKDSTIASEVTIKTKTIYTYEFISGDNQKFEKGTISGYLFRIDGDYSKFESLVIEGITLEKDEDYTVTEGSTIITFTEKGIAKLNTLVAGKYSVTAKYLNNKVVLGSLVINEEEKTKEDPVVPEKEDQKEEQKDPVVPKKEESKKEEIKKEEQKLPVEDKIEENPQTSDNIGMSLIICLLSLFGLLIYKKEYKRGYYEK